MAAEIKPGTYRGRAIVSSAQHGLSESNQPQIALDFELTDQNGKPAGKATIALSFHKNAALYSIDRLRACGWKGKDPYDLRGVDQNEVPIRAFLDDRSALKFEINVRGSTFQLRRLLPDEKKDAYRDYVGKLVAAYEKNPPRSDAGTSEEPANADDEVPF